MRRGLIALLLVLWAVPALAQDPIPAARKTDWSYAGVPGGIPTYSQTCYTFNATTGTAAAVQAKIAECASTYPNGSVIVLQAGNYVWSDTVYLSSSKVILRGAGADQTIIQHGPSNSYLLLLGYGGSISGEVNIPITGGGTKDSFSFTVSSASGLSIGQVIQMKRDDDAALVYTIFPTVSHMRQVNRITNITGTGNPYTITVQNPLAFNFSAGTNPVVWVTWSNQTTGSGIEDLKLDHSAYTGGLQTSLKVEKCYGCWIKGIEVYKGNNHGILIHSALNSEVRDSFIHESQTYGSNNSGITISPNESYGDPSNIRIENNILDKTFPEVEFFGSTTGNVVAYNYLLRPQSAAESVFVTWALDTNHNTHPMLNLWEGNITPMIGADGYHGSSSHDTYFRNLVTGATLGISPPAIEIGNAVWLMRFNYYFNIIGNVLGSTETVPSHYEFPIGGGPSCGGWCSVPYYLGYPKMGAIGDTTQEPNTWDGIACRGMYISCPAPVGQPVQCPCDSSKPNKTYPDTTVKSTLFRWGNYDFYNDAVRWEASEVPADMSVPGNQTLRSSYYLTSKPSWFGSVAWPPIGPDVTATTHGGVGTSDASGHANKIPAQLCWESRNLLTGGTFNANACYYSGVAAPNAPTNVRIR